MRLIDADVTLKHIDEYYDLLKRMGKPSRGMTAVMQNIKTIVNSLQTVDAVPVRHGKWIEYPIADGMNQCSACGVLRFGDSNYCPYCGALMDGETERRKK